jgi:uncharacterized Zn-binding protein involved in type VI secretion
MGQQVHRLGDVCTGHGCYGSRSNVGASADVLANGIGVHRVGDPWSSHCCGPSCHAATQSTGSPTVFVNSRPMARVGDGVSCGSRNQTGSPNVFAG